MSEVRHDHAVFAVHDDEGMKIYLRISHPTTESNAHAIKEQMEERFEGRDAQQFVPLEVVPYPPPKDHPAWRPRSR